MVIIGMLINRFFFLSHGSKRALLLTMTMMTKTSLECAYCQHPGFYVSCCLCRVMIGAARVWSHHKSVKAGTSVDCNGL
jgi:hypothetical protein